VAGPAGTTSIGPVGLVIQHVSFEVESDELDACIEFYELLGFRRMTAPKELADYVTWLERDGDQLHLFQLPDTSRMNAGHTAVPLGDDYEATQTRLREAGHQVDDTTSAEAHRARSCATGLGTWSS
jgi:hypothetical protein